MPNTKSAEKRLRQSEERRLRNKSVHSRMKTEVKKAMAAITKKEQTADTRVRIAFKQIDKAAGKGVIHPNAAARRKSRLARKLNAIS